MDPKNNIYGVCTWGIMPHEMEAHYLVLFWINGKMKIFPDHQKIDEFNLNPFNELKAEFSKPLKEINIIYNNEKIGRGFQATWRIRVQLKIIPFC